MQEILDKVYSFLEEAAAVFAEHVEGYDANGPDSDRIMNLANEMAEEWGKHCDEWAREFTFNQTKTDHDQDI